MKLKKLTKIHEGKFLTYYVADYENKEGKIKSYEFISRDHNLDMNKFGNANPQGVGMVTFSMDMQRILLEKEFRLACNNYVYNFPAGLIDKGETALEAARRELKEETGVELKEVIDVLSPSYTSQGTSDEAMIIVLCKCEGEISDSCYSDEEIETRWYTKEEIRKLLSDGAYMSVRTQMFLYQWVSEKL